MFCFFGHKACGISAPQPEIEPIPPCTGRVSVYWMTREVPLYKNKWKMIINMLNNTIKISKILPGYFVKYPKKNCKSNNNGHSSGSLHVTTLILKVKMAKF